MGRSRPARFPDVPDAEGLRKGTGPRARLEVVFATNRPLDDWTCQVIEAGAQLTAMVLEVERASDRMMMASTKRQADGAAPLIGSSDAIRRVRERIERVAATNFTVLIEGAIGPQPHLIFIEVFSEVAVGDGHGKAARAGEGGAKELTDLSRKHAG